MSNPNVGLTTTAEEAVSGNQKVRELIDEYLCVDYMCAKEDICPEIQDQICLLYTSIWRRPICCNVVMLF